MKIMFLVYKIKSSYVSFRYFVLTPIAHTTFDFFHQYEANEDELQ